VLSEITVSTSVPAGIGAIGIPVASEGPVPKDVGISRTALTAMGFEGKCCETLVLPPDKSKSVRILVGIGVPKEVNEQVLRKIAASLARAASKYNSLATSLPMVGRFDRKRSTQIVVEGVCLATHRYVDLKNDKKSAANLDQLTLIAPTAATAAVKAGAVSGRTIATAVTRARDFANMPPAYLTARKFADHAVDIAKANGLRATVYNRDQLQAMGCGGIVGVNQGSVEPPRVVKLVYSPRNASKKVVLVGKGVMYDSGGISLKPSDASHASMKMDMSGAAAVLATMSTLKDLKCTTAVTAYLMCTDNMPSGSALKLGDVLTMRNGKTVEIHNTDAEGRLILADGLSMGVEQKPDAMVDIATLTGACMVALGKKMAGLFGNNDAFIEQVKSASERTDELVWQLPLFGEYRKMLDSNVADMRNIGGPVAGATTAALFLKEFVAEVPWVHLDIAGPMEAEADEAWLQRGATAFGTRLLIDLVTNFKKPVRRK